MSIHYGSRGLGHQVGTDYLRRMALAAAEYGIALPDRELACAPLDSPVGRAYLGAMRAAINCALANRQVITHLARRAFVEAIPGAELPLLYDVSHNTCKLEEHIVDGHIPGACSCTARRRHGLSGQDIRTCRRHCAPSASRC